jgi:hypothetical protein
MLVRSLAFVVLHLIFIAGAVTIATVNANERQKVAAVPVLFTE